MKSLTECRKEIDEINSELLKLLERRIRVTDSVAEYKIANNMKVFDEEREKAILDKIASLAPSDMTAEMTGTFDSIMNMAKLHEYRITSQKSPARDGFKRALETSHASDGVFVVGVQGVEGAYSEMSARAMFPNADIRFYANWSQVFAALESGEIVYGVLPVENSTYGSVTDVYRLINEHDAYIVAANCLKIEHCLLAKQGTKLDDVREIMSHPQALGQCAGYISKHGCKPVSATNTAVAAETVSKSDRNDLAAIARIDCAEKYGLEILERGVQDEPHNATRFVAVSRQLEIPSDADKISIRFSLAHREGTLSRILGCFAALGLNLTKIESSPIPSRPFEYRFFLDFIGSMRDESAFDLICALSDELGDFRFMGNYHEISEI
ncbi:MAG: bifunctional chorismate mutase/prephenate dehydratase [Clostridiales bacterium]|nr:bifunctional chorismate mutase/prephenate dehydratase [Clostridiales bacterium]